MGNTVQTYDYSVYGQVGALDASHPNRLMFTGREFDKETGLYYYRARYYKSEIGRFLQVDPVGYGAGMNLYRYCGNNPWNYKDPYGLDYNDSNDSNDSDNPNSPNYDECRDVRPVWGPWGGIYTNPDDAAHHASMIIGSEFGSEMKDHEFFYWIYSWTDAEGKRWYSHTAIFREEAGQNIQGRTQKCAMRGIPRSADMNDLAAGHSHMHGEDFSGLNPNDPGDWHVGDWLWVNNPKNPTPLYLLTPEGKVLVLQPGSDQSSSVGTVNIFRNEVLP